MFIMRFVCLVTFVFIVSCASSDKVDSVSDGGDLSPEGSSSAHFSQGSDSGKIDGLNTVFFEYDKAELSSDVMATLEANAKWFRDKSYVVQLEGHCDERGSQEYNLSLGSRRAEFVKNILIKKGVSTSKIRVISYGEERPLSSGSTEVDYSKNRRVNFVPIGG